MGKGQKGHPHRKKQQKQLACISCTVLLVILIIVLAVLYFSLFKPKDPKVQVPTMQLLTLYSSVNSVNLSLNLQVSMYNPNRATFFISDGSTACLYYYGNQVGFAPVPTGTIPSQSFSTISVGLTVQGPSPLQGSSLYADIASGILQVSTSVTILGQVTTLNIFSHHSDVVSKCSVNVSLAIRGIESYTCDRSYSLDE